MMALMVTVALTLGGVFQAAPPPRRLNAAAEYAGLADALAVSLGKQDRARKHLEAAWLAAGDLDAAFRWSGDSLGFSGLSRLAKARRCGEATTYAFKVLAAVSAKPAGELKRDMFLQASAPSMIWFLDACRRSLDDRTRARLVAAIPPERDAVKWGSSRLLIRLAVQAKDAARAKALADAFTAAVRRKMVNTDAYGASAAELHLLAGDAAGARAVLDWAIPKVGKAAMHRSEPEPIEKETWGSPPSTAWKLAVIARALGDRREPKLWKLALKEAKREPGALRRFVATGQIARAAARHGNDALAKRLLKAMPAGLAKLRKKKVPAQVHPALGYAYAAVRMYDKRVMKAALLPYPGGASQFADTAVLGLLATDPAETAYILKRLDEAVGDESRFAVVGVWASKKRCAPAIQAWSASPTLTSLAFIDEVDAQNRALSSLLRHCAGKLGPMIAAASKPEASSASRAWAAVHLAALAQFDRAAGVLATLNGERRLHAAARSALLVRSLPMDGAAAAKLRALRKP